VNETGDVRSALDFQGLGQLRAQAAQTKDAASNPALRKAAEQFEAMFLQVMLKTMREATASNEEGDLMGSSTTKTYEALFDQEVAQEMAKKGGVGLANMLVKSFERNQPGQVHVDPRGLTEGIGPEGPAFSAKIKRFAIECRSGHRPCPAQGQNESAHRSQQADGRPPLARGMSHE
jgi:Rod binding domain-containing protein